MWLNENRANLLLEILTPIAEGKAKKTNEYSTAEKNAASEMIRYAKNYLETKEQKD